MASYHQLVEKQREFYRSGGTSDLAGRIRRIESARKLIEENREAIDAAIFSDLGRKSSDVPGSLKAIDTVLKHIKDWVQPQKVPFPEGSSFKEDEDELFLIPEPLGVVLVIGPWNYPLITIIPFIHILAAGDSSLANSGISDGPILKMGNTVIIKPPDLAPHFSELFGQIVPRYFDERELSVVEGGIPETTALLEERFDHILYTGCPPVGKIIMAAAAKHLTPVTLELGGKSPCYVDDSADLSIVVEGVKNMKLSNCGQICVSIDYILTTVELKPKLLDALRQGFDELGDLKNYEGYARIVNHRHYERLATLLEKTKGRLAYKSQGEASKDEKYLPVHILEVELDDELLKEEIFGPILPIVTVPSFDFALSYIKNREKPLAAYIYSQKQEQIARFLRETSSGGVKINDNLATASGLPFGGIGNSGMGRLNGKWGFDTFTHEKPVVARKSITKGLNLGL